MFHAGVPLSIGSAVAVGLCPVSRRRPSNPPSFRRSLPRTGGPGPPPAGRPKLDVSRGPRPYNLPLSSEFCVCNKNRGQRPGSRSSSRCRYCIAFYNCCGHLNHHKGPNFVEVSRSSSSFDLSLFSKVGNTFEAQWLLLGTIGIHL